MGNLLENHFWLLVPAEVVLVSAPYECECKSNNMLSLQIVSLLYIQGGPWIYFSSTTLSLKKHNR